MSKPRRSAAAETPQPDPRHVEVGSYERQADGSVKRTDEPTKPAEVEHPQLDLDAARATAAALIEVGAEVPPHIQAQIAAADAPSVSGEDSSPPPSGAGGQTQES